MSAGAYQDEVAEHLPDLLRLATMLVGAGAAADLVGDVLFVARPGQLKNRDVDLLPQRLRDLVVTRYLAGQRRSPRRSALAPDSSPMLARIELLPVRQRAVLVLAVSEQLTRAEIGGIIDEGVGKVAADLEKAVTRLGDPAPEVVAAALSVLARSAPAPEGVRIWQTVHRRGVLSAARSRRQLGVAAVIVAVLILAVAAPRVIIPRLPVETRAFGDLAFIHEVIPPEGWQPYRRFLKPDSEGTTLVRTNRSQRSDLTGCEITVYVPGAFDPATLEEEQDVLVKGRPGFFATDRASNAGYPALAWQYAPDGWATVSCPGRSGRAARQLILQMADAVTFARQPARLPFRVGYFPHGYTLLSMATTRTASSGNRTSIWFQTAGPDPSYLRVSMNDFDAATARTATETILINGTNGYFDRADRSLCMSRSARLICVATGDYSGTESQLRAADRPLLIEVAEGLELATDPANPDTWFDANQAFQHR